MADYGGILMDSSGRRFARVDGGDSYHYWGRVDTGQLGPNWVTLPLFGIPTSVPIIVFIHCNFGGNEDWRSRYGKAEVRQIDGQWKARAFRSFGGDIEPSFQSASFYVFVPARYIPADKWGMQCFNEAGVKMFDSARPLLQVCGLGKGGILTTGESQFFNRTPAKCAAPYCSTSSAQYIVVNSVPYWAIVHYYGTTTNGNLAGYTGVIAYLDSGGTRPQNSQFVNIPLLDAGYYDQFTNLGTF